METLLDLLTDAEIYVFNIDLNSSAECNHKDGCKNTDLYKGFCKIHRKPDTFFDSKEGFDTKCKVCLENTVAVLSKPCHHISMCFSCSKTVNDKCPVCRTSIKKNQLVFFS